MSAIDKLSIALPRNIAKMIKDAVASGDYASSSDVIREALREWQRNRTLGWSDEELRQAWRQGLASGPSQFKSIEDIIAKAKRIKAAELAREGKGGNGRRARR